MGIMGDPTGISGALISKLVDVGLDELKAIYQCKDKCAALDKYLQTIRPMVSSAAESLSRDGSTQAELGIVLEWLNNLKIVLEKADLEVSTGRGIGRYRYFKLRQVSKRISDITAEIQDFFSRQASVALLILGAQTNQTAHEISNKVDELNKGLNDLRIEHKLSDLDVRTEAEQFLDDLQQLPGKIFGRDVLLAKLKGRLVNRETDNKWVGVSARGGMGKTVLAKQAFNSKDIRDHFEKRFWLTVGREPSIESLLQNLADHMGVNTRNMKPAQVKTNLVSALDGKIVLLVLDNVWDDARIRGIPLLDWLNVSSGTGSKTLVTTCQIRLLRKKRVLDEVKVEQLTEEESWELFCEHAFKGVDNIPLQLDQSVIKAVVGECKGIPLALKVIAGALAHEVVPEIWQRQLGKLKNAQPLDQDHEVGLYRTLKISYDSLASVNDRLQKCFVYFAAFPEDYDVDSVELANLWAGEELLKADDGANNDFDPSEECFYLLTELIERSLIDLQWSESTNPLHLKCRIHDVLRDFARHLIRKNEAPMDYPFRAGEGLTQVPNNWLQDPSASVSHASLAYNRLNSLPNELNKPMLEVVLPTDLYSVLESPSLVKSPDVAWPERLSLLAGSPLAHSFCGTLHSGESLVSAAEEYTFINQDDGNLVTYTQNGQATWASGTGPGRLTRGDLKLFAEGNLVLFDTSGTGKPVWASMSQGTARSAGPYRLVTQDDGNLVIYGNSGATWATRTLDTTSGHFTNVAGTAEMSSVVVTWLQPCDTLVSRNRMYTFVNQADGNLCVYKRNGRVTWSSGTYSKGTGNLYMQRGGDLVLYNTDGEVGTPGAPMWSSGTFARGSGPYKLAMQDDGNLVIYDSNQKPTWATNPAFRPDVAWPERLSLLAGSPLAHSFCGTLHSGESLVSAAEEYTFINQDDGNLVTYTQNGQATCASGTGPGRLTREDLKLFADGNLVLFDTNGTGKPVWASMSQGTARSAGPYRLVIQDDGNLVIYGNSGATWATRTLDTTSGHFTNVAGTAEMSSVVVTWLQPCDTLVSRNRMYTFVNQADGNLCVYKRNGRVTWSLGTYSKGTGNLYMQRGGDLVLYNTDGEVGTPGAPMWSSGTFARGSGPYKLAMQDDGNLVIYDSNHHPTWAINTS